MDRRAAFFLGAAVVSAVLIPVTEQEQRWMSINPFTALVRLVALAGIAVAIGVSASQLANPPSSATVAAVSE